MTTALFNVQMQWLYECFRQEKRVDETPYLVNNVPDKTPPKPRTKFKPMFKVDEALNALDGSDRSMPSTSNFSEAFSARDIVQTVETPASLKRAMRKMTKTRSPSPIQASASQDASPMNGVATEDLRERTLEFEPDSNLSDTLILNGPENSRSLHDTLIFTEPLLDDIESSTKISTAHQDKLGHPTETTDERGTNAFDNANPDGLERPNTAKSPESKLTDVGELVDTNHAEQDSGTSKCPARKEEPRVASLPNDANGDSSKLPSQKDLPESEQTKSIRTPENNSPFHEQPKEPISGAHELQSSAEIDPQTLYENDKCPSPPTRTQMSTLKLTVSHSVWALLYCIHRGEGFETPMVNIHART